VDWYGVAALIMVIAGVWIRLVYLHSRDADQRERAGKLLHRGDDHDDPPQLGQGASS
jgi:hypothetical protein